MEPMQLFKFINYVRNNMNIKSSEPRKKCIHFISSIIILVISCAGLFYKVETIHDDFDGYTINRTQGNEIKGKGSTAFEIATGVGSAVELNAQRFQLKGGIVSYSLIVKFTGTDWLFIKNGEALILLIDGERIGFQGEGSLNHRNVGRGWIEEQAWFDISLDDLLKIANAKEVRLKIIGSQYYIERTFVEFNFKNFKDFITKYCKDDMK